MNYNKKVACELRRKHLKQFDFFLTYLIAFATKQIQGKAFEFQGITFKKIHWRVSFVNPCRKAAMGPH